MTFTSELQRKPWCIEESIGRNPDVNHTKAAVLDRFYPLRTGRSLETGEVTATWYSSVVAYANWLNFLANDRCHQHGWMCH